METPIFELVKKKKNNASCYVRVVCGYKKARAQTPDILSHPETLRLLKQVKPLAQIFFGNKHQKLNT